MDNSSAYLRHYKQQLGGDFPVFVGMRNYQSGAGIGDFFRGFFRRALPVVLRGASSFLGNLVKAKEEGASYKDAAISAAKAAAVPTLQATAAAAKQSLDEQMNGDPAQKQVGSGVYKRKRITKHKHKKQKRVQLRSPDFEGIHYNF